MPFCVLRRNSRWTPKMAGKPFFAKRRHQTVKIPWGQKFCQNCSISHRFLDECILVFNAEIQDGCKKWWENDFGCCIESQTIWPYANSAPVKSAPRKKYSGQIGSLGNDTLVKSAPGYLNAYKSE